MFIEKTFHHEGTAIHYAEGPPSGPPMLLQHGLSQRWQVFLPLLSHLAMRWRVFAPDLRGHGRSSRSPEGYGFETWAGDTEAFIRQKISEPAILFGHSLGGMVALMAAARLGPAVKAVVVGDSTLFWEGLQAEPYRQAIDSLPEFRDTLRSHPTESGLLSALLADREKNRWVRSEDELWVRFWARSLSLLDPEVYTGVIEAFRDREAFAAGYDCEALLPAIACPVLLLQANRDLGGILTDGEVARARVLLPGLTHVRLEQMGHMLGLNTWRIKPVLRAIFQFLESL